MSLLDNAADRAAWLATVNAITVQLQRLETAISLAMADRPQPWQVQRLAIADTELGEAAAALTIARAAIGGLTDGPDR